MLNLDAPVQLRGLTLYRDYNDTGLYWYMPDHPKLAREGGQPLFQLLLYRRDITDNPDFQEGQERGGGFLMMTVELGVSQATQDAVAAELEGMVGEEVRLAAVPFEKGKVRVTALGVSAGATGQIDSVGEDETASSGPRFVERILGSAMPSLYGDNRAVFSIELSQEGAQLMRASLEDDGASAISVVYELEYVGLKPAREVSIKIEYHQSYSYLRNKVKANSLWFKADIDAETEKLEQNGSIEIEDVNYLELEPAALAERSKELNTLAKELAQWTFFKPALKPGEVLAKDRGEISVYDPTTAAATNTAGFTTPLDLLRSGTGRTDDGPATVRGGTERTGGARGNAGATTNQPSGTNTQPGSSGTPQTREPTAVERWNQAGRPQVGFLMRSLDQEESQTLTYDMRQVSAQRRTAAPQGSIRLLSGDSDLSGRIKSVDLNDPFFERIKGSVTSGIKFDEAGVRSIVVAVRYGVRPDGSGPKDSDEWTIEQQGQKHTFEFFLDHRKSVELEYRVTVHYQPGYAIGDEATSVTTDWLRTSTRNLDIDPRSLQALMPVRLTAGQVDWDAVQSLQSTVSYRDVDRNIDAERTVVLSREQSSALVPIRPSNVAQRTYAVASTYFYPETRETVQETRSRGTEVVLNQPASKAIPVSISARDPLGRLEKVSVELEYDAGDGSRLQSKVVSLTGGESISWTFFRPSDLAKPSYRFRTTLFGRDGTTERSEWASTTERQLLVGDRFPGMLEVQVELVGDLAAANVMLAKLTLIYPDAPEGIDNRHEVAYRPGSVETLDWKVPSATREPGEYEWSVMYVRGDGSRTTESGTSSDELLLLFVPQPE